MPTKRIFHICFYAALAAAASIFLPACSPTTQAAGYFPPSARTRITCIIQRESGGNPRAISPTGDYGILQLNRLAHKAAFEARYHRRFETYALTVEYNASYARYLYDYYAARGLSPFTPWNGGRYAC